jgi:hypothetical protein
VKFKTRKEEQIEAIAGRIAHGESRIQQLQQELACPMQGDLQDKDRDNLRLLQASI